MITCTFKEIDSNGKATGSLLTLTDPDAGMILKGLKLGDVIELNIASETFGKYKFTKAELASDSESQREPL